MMRPDDLFRRDTIAAWLRDLDRDWHTPTLADLIEGDSSKRPYLAEWLEDGIVDLPEPDRTENGSVEQIPPEGRNIREQVADGVEP